MEINIEQKWSVKGDPFLPVPEQHKHQLVKYGREVVTESIELRMFVGAMSRALICSEHTDDFHVGEVVNYEGTWTISSLP